MADSSLIKRFSRLFRVTAGDDMAVVVGTDDQALPSVNRTTEKPRRGASGWSTFQGVGLWGGMEDDRHRQEAYGDYRRIDANIPEMSRALTIIATDATAGDRGGRSGFRLEHAENLPESDRGLIYDLVVKRLALQKNIYSIIRNANKFGDVFKELIVDKQGIIWRLKNLEPELTTRVVDVYDRHIGFRYKGYEGDNQSLEWWQVVHLRHDHEDGALYGRSLFAGGGRTVAQRLMAIRDSLAYEALMHATARNVFVMGYPPRMSEEERDNWIDDLKDELRREMVIDSEGKLSRRAISMLNSQDILLPYMVDTEGKGAKPEVIPLKNAPIGDLKGIAEHFQDLTFVVTGVPKAFFGVERAGEGIGSTRLDKQDLQFARQLRRDQEDAAWFVLEVIRRQFVFLGLEMPKDAVTIVMPDLREVDRKLRAEVLEILMRGAKMGLEAGLPMPYIWNEVVFDGMHDAAAAAASRYGFDPYVTQNVVVGADGQQEYKSPSDHGVMLEMFKTSTTNMRELAHIVSTPVRVSSSELAAYGG
jgi:hypothetical protein